MPTTRPVVNHDNAALFGPLRISALGANNAPDAEIMAYARAHDYVVVTHDLDFSAILAATHGEKPSVVQIRTEDACPAPAGERLTRHVDRLCGRLDAGQKY